ncbi:MAG: hypothetical protein V3T72_01350 [Thermoanaerobaculia bacterium]
MNTRSAIRPKFFKLTLAATLAMVALSALSAPADAQPTLSKIFTPNTIGPGSVSTITLTITNGSASPVTDLAFADTLPAAITIADPANASTDCDLGISDSLTAPDGGSTITLSDAQIGGSQSCTVTVDVTASTPGAHTNPAITLTSSAGSSMSLAVDLTVTTTLLGFSKSFAPSTVPLGGRSTLTFTIDNSLNPTFALLMAFTDNLPTGMEVAGPANASTDCNFFSAPVVTAVPGTSVVSLSVAGVAAMSTCTVTVDVTATGVGMLDNISGELTAAFGGAFTIFSNGKASDTLDVTVTPIALQKSFTDDPLPPGGTVTLDFTIDNFDRDFSATAIAFTDDLTTLVPALAGLTFDSLLSNGCGGSVSGAGGTTIGFTDGTLGPESSCTLSVSLSVPAGATPGAYTNTTSTITATVAGSPVVGNMASDDLFVEPVPLLTKEFLEDGTLLPDPVINPGDDVVIRFTITNTSTTSMATDVAFLDELTDGGPSTGFLPFPVTVTLPPVPDPPCGAGSSLALIVVATDRQGLSLTGGSLAAAPGAGSSCTFDVTLSIPLGLGPAIYVNTTEEITATVDGATRIGDPASDTLTVIAAPSLSKAFTDDPVAPGGTVTLEFTLTYPEDASGDATAITFTDNLAPVLAGLTANLPPTPDPPCGAGSSLTGSAGDTLLTFMGGTLMPGQSCAFSVTLDVPIGAAPGSHTNTTSGVSATVEGLAATSAPASDDLEVAGLDFTKEFLGDPIIAGDTLTLRFTIENISPNVTDDATGITFTDNLTAGLPGLTATGGPSVDTCGGTLSGTATFLIYTGGSLTIGSTCTIEVEVLVPAAAADGDYLNVTSSLTATVDGSLVIIDPATDLLTVDSNLLQLSKAFTDDPVAPGDSVTLEFTLTNLDAGQAASSIDFTDNLDAALTSLTYDTLLLNTCGGTVSGLATTMITVSGASLTAAGSCTIRASLSVPGAAAASIYPSTTSAVTGTIDGFAVSGDAASDELEVIQLLLFSKSFDGPTTATGMATLTFTITNPGPDTASGISFSDDLDAVISGLIAISLPAVPCGAGSSITGVSFLTFTGGELPPMGGMCSFDVDVLVPATATAGTFPNTTSDLFQAGLKVADPATADLDVLDGELGITKSFVVFPVPPLAGPGPAVLRGGFVIAEYTITNPSPVFTVINVAFSDDLDSALPGLAALGLPVANVCGTGSQVAGTSVVTLTGGILPPNTSCIIGVVLQVPAGAALGIVTSTTGSVTGDLSGVTVTGAPASADLEVVFIDFVKEFGDGAAVGSLVTLTFTLINPDPSNGIDDLVFTDDLSAVLPGLEAIGLPENDVCGLGSVLTGTSLIALAGGSLGPNESCAFAVTLQIPPTAASGQFDNLTSVLEGSVNGLVVAGDPAGAAMDTLDVQGTPLEIPTLTGWGLLALCGLLALFGVRRLRRR